MDKNQIAKLIKKYESLTPAERRKYNESMTCKNFILPLFQALGWDVYGSEVTSEDQVSGKRVDFAFHLGDVIEFFLEAKKIGADLREERYAEQTVMYAWHKSVSWAVLTNFESLKVFNAEWDEPDAERSLVFEINYKNYLADKKLLMLSKEAMEKGELDKYAEENYKKPKREPVDKQLAEDLVRWRDILFNKIKGWNSDKKISDEKIAESVQRLLDRFIFIRTTEDRRTESGNPIENRHLQELERNWNDKGENLTEGLMKLFKDYDEWYNSKLFQPHACDSLEYEDGFLAEVIGELYKNRRGIRYDFASIPADVFGSIYEQYLGKIQANGKEKKSAKRKSQGIYYTLRYIVDYIVQNALGEMLKEKTLRDALKIKILDPACGSGSFLIKAFEVLDDYIKRKKNQVNADSLTHFLRQASILTSNIYGVDLDDKAVEIAQLNLLLKLLYKRERLPNLAQNVKCGNSLISGKEEELKKYFGKDWKLKKPFNWGEEFPEVFQQDGFDVIIGNPPWVSLKGKQKSLFLPIKEIEYLIKRYNCDSYRPNLFEMFIWRSLSLLKQGGVLSFVVPDRLCTNEQFAKLREYLIKNFSIKKLWFRVDFPGIIGDTIIFTLKNKKPDNNYIEIAEYPSKEFLKIPQDIYKNPPDYSFFYINKAVFGIFTKISNSNKTQELSKLAKTSVGFIAKEGRLTRDKISKKQSPALKGENINRYNISGNFWFEFIKEYLAGGTQDKEKLGASDKILLRKTGNTLMASFCGDGNFYPEQSLYFIYDLNKKDLIYLLAILNSRLMHAYYWNFAITNRDATPQLKKVDLDKFPIYKINFSNKQEKVKYDELIKLVDKMLKLNKKLQKLDPHMNEKEYNEFKKEIEKTDVEIDSKVYKLYGLAPEEIKIIESFNSNKK